MKFGDFGDNLNNFTEEFAIFLYDYYVRLRSSLNRIKQLQLFSIWKYSVDYVGNQWFLYKPKYPTVFPKTDENANIYCSENKKDDIDLDLIKSNPETTDLKTTAGELWVRLRNFPFAYPVELNTTSIIKTQLWNQVLASEIYNFDIFDNFGYVYYLYSGSKYITFFTIEDTYRKEPYLFTDEMNFKSIIDESLIYYKVTNKNGVVETRERESIESINKRILINPLKTYKFKSTETFIDCVSSSGLFYVFYYDKNITSNNVIYLTEVDSSEAKILNSNIARTSTINLPKYDFNGINLCKPVADGNWSISVSADNINVAYESVPMAN